MEQVLQGWLVKSPPEKKSFGTWKIFGAKWRRRYFVLYAPPTVEDFPTDTVSAILEYYSDKKLHNKCGSIDLTTCEEVYSALDSETYKHVFCIQTTHKCRSRTYYLAAETEAEMNKWVMTLCQVLGLAETDDQPTFLPAVIEAKIQQILQPLTIPRPVTQPPLNVKPKLNFSTHPSAKQLSPELPPNRPLTLAGHRNYGSESNLLDSLSCSANDTKVSRVSGNWSRSSVHTAGSYPDLSPRHVGQHGDEPPPLPPERSVTSPPKPDAGDIQPGYYDHPGSVDTFYNTPPIKYPHTNDATEFYNVPPTTYPAERDKNVAGAFYDVPPTDETDKQPAKNARKKQSEAQKSEVTGGDVYNVPPVHDADDSWMSSGRPDGASICLTDQTYDIPSAEQRGGKQQSDDAFLSASMTGETYDTPVGNEIRERPKKPQKPVDKQSVNVNMSISDQTYDTPPTSESLVKPLPNKPHRAKPRSSLEQSEVIQHSRQFSGQETYDIPPASQHSRHPTTAVKPSVAARSHRQSAVPTNETYDVPPQKSAGGRSSNRISLSGAADLAGLSQPGMAEEQTYNVPASCVPPVPAKRSQAPPPKPPRPVGTLSTNSVIINADSSVSSAKTTQDISDNELLEKDTVAELPTGGVKGRYQQKSSFHSSNASAPPCVAKKGEIHDSIRFTQRSKSFKRSIPGQQRSELPLPVKRYVDPGDSSPSSSDDESSSPVSQDTSHLTESSHLTEDSQLETSV